MADDEKEPVVEHMLSGDGGTAIPWAKVRERLSDWSENRTTWLATVRPDGRPHVVPVGAVWLDGALYFQTGQGTRKGENLEHNSRCVITTASRDLDIVIEGDAAKMRDEAKLQRVAELYNSIGWPAIVRDGAFDAPFNAPTTGPAPYDVYEVTPTKAFAFGSEEATAEHFTRYRF